MAGLQGFGAGLLQGYEAADRIQDRHAAREQKQERIDNQERYRQQRLGMQQQRMNARQDERDYQHDRDDVADERWQKEFGLKQSQQEAQSERADARLGIARQRANISARNAATRAKMSEVQLAHEQRKQREAENRRYLSAATQELQANGVTQRFRDLSQKGGVDVDNMLNPEWQQARETITAGLQGGPVSRKSMVDAGNTFFHDRIERMVGQKTKDGKEIVRTKLNDFYPGPDGDKAVMDLDVWTKDKNGKVSKYTAPATSNRRSDDDYVLQVPIDQLVGHVKAMDTANKAIDKRKLASVIDQQATLNGGGPSADAGQSGEWKSAGQGLIYNDKTSQTKRLPKVKDEGERYVKAVDFANDEIESRRKSGRLYDSNGEPYNDNQIQQLRLKLRNQYLRDTDPEASSNGDNIPDSGGPNSGSDQVVIKGDPQHGDITESDIQTTMEETGMSRDQVMERLQNGA
ncbi:hypothetical protein V5738_10805 [Salinisphaera sp. SPP-AMP-43]|uniref:hypothetical protein n=1 Tax=Salinisphaera sp. SPP-AMP-43 TaxID=3121288 RepID=UPI003C6E02D0